MYPYNLILHSLRISPLNYSESRTELYYMRYGENAPVVLYGVIYTFT